MKDLAQQNFSEDVLSDEEIDQLFSEILQVEPPTWLVDTILAAAARLSLPQFPKPKIPWHNLQILRVRLDYH